ncbi:hypothetical protein E3P92_01576 [Wallemia ichthyophaga]|uniref:GPN-loop GTPase n=1 Tax=Wallemia ichthyophaga TaxID=245174 RepID=A0A4T0JJ51_WALIC|nr:hypothetical protein E3P91_01413 [Wallemia ichthyophaga]TIA82407.1 hypothetical protein E3P98_01434 [Wallemia ichthyophaga]TIA91831.1 hypothetical protein E3P97_01814 [Wallemia ichthyophaga]TIB00902.1 hypothetical protein E3P95_01529 [Wallemia ichthyophaga]TIB01918.1 hypothetical protein E3P94_01661 [Wallemia ichthyophaga]
MATHTQTENRQPTSIILLGMAGSGKSTVLQRLNSYLHAQNDAPYVINLDPAVRELNYSANIDIRDTVDYSKVMKQYNLGPNGGIITSLNLFTTKFDQVLGLIEKRKNSVNNILIDTPGQIEIFTWSASASEVPTVIGFVVDTPRTMAPATFMSNMLYACSILYKTRLPLLLIFNKTDVQDCSFANEWMTDFESFQAALSSRSATSTHASTNQNEEPSYMNSLMNSMSLVLEEFYANIRSVGVSAMTGDGMPEFFDAVDKCRGDYYSDYKPELDRLRKEREEKSEASKQDSIDRLMKDMKTGGEEEQPIESDASEEEGETLDAQDMKERRGMNATANDVANDDGTSWPTNR